MISSNEELLGRARRLAGPLFAKLKHVQESYLKEFSEDYCPSRLAEIRRGFEAVDFKWFAANLHLEELWALSEASRWGLSALIENSVKSLDWSDDQKVWGSTRLEAFLFQARAFLDMYMRGTCLVMNVSEPVPSIYPSALPDLRLGEALS